MLWKVIITALSGSSDVIDYLSLSGKYKCTPTQKLLISGSSMQWNIVWEIFWTWMKGRVVNDIPSRANSSVLVYWVASVWRKPLASILVSFQVCPVHSRNPVFSRMLCVGQLYIYFSSPIPKFLQMCCFYPTSAYESKKLKSLGVQLSKRTRVTAKETFFPSFFLFDQFDIAFCRFKMSSVLLW